MVSPTRDHRQLEETRVALARAVELEPRDPRRHVELANVLSALGRLDDAAATFLNALRLQPELAEAILGLGITLGQMGRHDDALYQFRLGVQFHPNLPQAHHNLGVALAQTGAPAEAARCFERAIELKPDYAEALHHLGSVLAVQNRHREAVEKYRRATQLKPDFAAAYNGLGHSLILLGQPEAAEIYLRHAVRCQRGAPGILNSLGMALDAQARWQEAVEVFQQALDVDPAYLEAHVNLGNTYRGLQEMEKAIACYELALTHRPDHTSAHFNLSLSLLQRGDFVRGFQEYEWRRGREDIAHRFTQPMWDGKPLDGRTIFIYSEQGLGDRIHFIRYLPLLKQLGGTVIFQCPAYLRPLLACCPGIDRLMIEEEELPPFDVFASLLSLPRLFGTTLENVPATVPYLVPPPELVARWKERLSEFDGCLKVGICWQGNPHHVTDRYRSVPLPQFAGIAALPNVRLISLQRTHGLDQLRDIADQFPVAVLQDELDRDSGAFVETAAVMMNLDLMITVDSALAHLAGALARPVWVALSRIQDWRWLMARDDSPWYPTMRLFRQQTVGNWRDVFNDMAAGMNDLQGL